MYYCLSCCNEVSVYDAVEVAHGELACPLCFELVEWIDETEPRECIDKSRGLDI
jgi:hypothetical protein